MIGKFNSLYRFNRETGNIEVCISLTGNIEVCISLTGNIEVCISYEREALSRWPPDGGDPSVHKYIRPADIYDMITGVL